LNQKKIYFWAPFLSNIATAKAVINSSFAINKYLNDFQPYIIDSIGEFESKKNELNEKNINVIKLSKFNFASILPSYGKIKSRFSFIIIFIINFFPLKKLLKTDKPEFLIIHLITILPLILFYFFNFKTKCILRISGYPKMGLFRVLLWKILLKNVHFVTCPTQSTLDYLKDLNVCDHNKLRVLYDPIIIVRELNIKLREKTKIDFKDFSISIGRLTKQKNFEFLIDNFYKNINSKLIILGNGEDLMMLKNKIKYYNLSDSIFIKPYQSNIFPYLKKSDCLFVSSLWEDPGFVIIEAAFCRTFIISSSFKICYKELILDQKAGLVFELNNKEDFMEKCKKFNEMSEEERNKYRKNALIMSKNFTIFRHAKQLHKILI
jgi:glycosyltransferase involved in cell wall biosynthesis